VCESTIALRDLRAESAEDVEEIRDSDRAGDMFAQALAISYLSRTPSAVDSVQSELEDRGEGCMALA
jgi:hypothetical protein